MVKKLSAKALGYARADKRLEILHQVGQCGSISQAARTAGVSYKAAWQAIQTLTNLAGEPLVDACVGGAGGGGAHLTLAGKRLLAAAAQLEAARHDVLAQLNNPRQSLAAPRTSMRNLLRCTVAALESAGPRDPLVRVVLHLPQVGEMATLITRESAELLGLAPGLAVLALCKATAVQVLAASGAAGAAASGAAGENRLHGRARRVLRGAQRDEITLVLADEQQINGFAARPHRMRVGSRAQALIEASAVVIALP
ncbi:MAG: LysR family transcriptional regulator [Burkholderiaceae bacterium]|jgi:molybdate transport system regulatory protein|nr:LysR family transcriptional regulator [Burkholderiaceae bacterium]